MNWIHGFGIVVLVQVTALTLVASLLIRVAHRSASSRHAIGVVAIMLALVSPELALALPQSGGWNLIKPWRHLAQPLAATPDSEFRIDSPTFAAPKGLSNSFPGQPSILAKRLHMTNESSLVLDRTDGASADTEPSAIGRSIIRANLADWTLQFLNLAGWFWIAGTLLLTFRLYRSQRRLRRLWISLQACSAVSESHLIRVDSVLDGVCQRLGLRERPCLTVSAASSLPLVLGVRRPLVVLPVELAMCALPERLRDVLVHECAHIARRDPWINLAQRMAAIMFWIHPGVAWLNRHIERAREEICDNFVLRHGDRADYAQTLLELAEHCAARRAAFPALGLFGSRWTLENRIAGLLDP